METWIFWGCAAVVVVSALAVVGQTRPARAFAVMLVLLAALAALCLLLSAPLVAAGVAVFALTLMAVGWWVATTLGGEAERSSAAVIGPASAPRRFGVALVVVFVLELAWVFRRVRGANLTPFDEVAPGLSIVSWAVAADHAMALLLVSLLALAVGVGASALVRRDP